MQRPMLWFTGQSISDNDLSLVGFNQDTDWILAYAPFAIKHISYARYYDQESNKLQSKKTKLIIIIAIAADTYGQYLMFIFRLLLSLNNHIFLMLDGSTAEK